MKYRQLSELERYQIDAGISVGFNLSNIAKRIGRHRSTVMREIKRNGHITREGYRAHHCCQQYELRRLKCRPKLKIFGNLKNKIDHCLKLQWSPEQIVGRARLEGLEMVGVETIYRYIYRDKLAGGDLWKNLRHVRKQRKKRFPIHRWPKPIPRPSIEQRPKEINDRTRIGDYERDLIVGKERRGYLLTIVDRRIKLTKILKIKHPNGNCVHEATIKALKGLPVKSLTNDNGCEFVSYRKTSKTLKSPIYFTRPYASWERGTVENTNKLIRQYFPKKTQIQEIPDEKIKMVETLLNQRPRKSLGYRTPLEALNKIL